jgi:heme/copper-type cytochrome/quinol oxidase subunit 4
MTKKKDYLLVLLISFGLTTLGLLIDTDPKNESIWTTVFEFFAMLAIIFVSVSMLYFVSIFLFRKIRQIGA